MIHFLKTLSLAPRGIRHKLTIAFALMSIIPMLVCGYLIVHYIFPAIKSIWDVSLIFVITLLLMCLGFYLAKKIIYPVVEIAAHAKEISEGKLNESLDVKAEDELGELSGSLNQLSGRLKENMTQLHSYGEKIRQINMEINKKVFALSSLLQIGNLITAACNLDEVFSLIVEKIAQLETSGVAFLMLLKEDSKELVMRAQINLSDEQIRLDKGQLTQQLFDAVLKGARPLVVDAQNPPKDFTKKLIEILAIKNIAVLPIVASGKVVGVLTTGNNKEKFLFTNDELELIGVFAKQVAVSIENDVLTRKTKELAVKDELTGLYNESYIRTRLDEEIKRAVSYQRPCGFIIFEFDNFKPYCANLGEKVAEKALKKIAQTLKDSATEIDKIARFSRQQFAVILPEQNKHQSLKMAENFKEEIEKYNLKQKDFAPFIPLKLKGGISATPLDGTTSKELINKALYYMETANSGEANKIII